MQADKNGGHIRAFIKRSKNIVILCASRGIDAVSAGVALSKYIEDKYQKSSTVVYEGDVGEINLELAEIHEILSDLEDQTLKIVIDYKGTDIESVDYYKRDGSKLVLEVKPVKRNFDTSRIEYNFEGGRYDLIISIGYRNLKNVLKHLTISRTDLDNAVIVNIDNSGENENFGRVNIVNLKAKTLSELIFRKFSRWKYVPNTNVSKALLLGLSSSSVVE